MDVTWNYITMHGHMNVKNGKYCWLLEDSSDNVRQNKDAEVPDYMDGYHHAPYTAWRHDIALPLWTRKPAGLSAMLLFCMAVKSSRIQKHGYSLPFAENVWNITSAHSNTFIAYLTEGITLPWYVLRPSMWRVGREREDSSCIIYEELPRTDIGGSCFDSGASIGSHLW